MLSDIYFVKERLMTQYSMALNNSDYLSGNPDARTGLFSKVCTLEKLKGNSLSGPSFKLQLSFNPQLDFQNYLTPFGSGWGLSVPAFTRVSDAGDGHLILPSGKNFYITGLKEGSVPMEGYLLRDIQTDWSNAAGILTVREKSGDIQRYSRLAGDQTGNLYLSQTSSSSGRSLYFSYDSGQFNLPGGGMLTCLTAVKDDDGTTLASINYSTAAGKGTVITLFSEKEMTRQFTFLQSNNALKSISGPEGYQASFTYYYNNADGGVPMYLLSTVADTQGLYERVIYSVASNPDSGGITLPGGCKPRPRCKPSSAQAICPLPTAAQTISRPIAFPGQEQTSITIWAIRSFRQQMRVKTAFCITMGRLITVLRSRSRFSGLRRRRRLISLRSKKSPPPPITNSIHW